MRRACFLFPRAYKPTVWSYGHLPFIHHHVLGNPRAVSKACCKFIPFMTSPLTFRADRSTCLSSFNCNDMACHHVHIPTQHFVSKTGCAEQSDRCLRTFHPLRSTDNSNHGNQILKHASRSRSAGRTLSVVYKHHTLMIF